MNAVSEKPVFVDPNLLSPDALLGVIHEFILRNGTDYGANEVSLETKTQQIQKQIFRKEIRIVFDAETESVTLLPRG